MNKHQRVLNEQRVRSARAKRIGWRSPFESLPAATRIALATTGGIRISGRSERKRFGKSTGKSCYGHFSGRSNRHGTRRDHQERAELREQTEEIRFHGIDYAWDRGTKRGRTVVEGSSREEAVAIFRAENPHVTVVGDDLPPAA